MRNKPGVPSHFFSYEGLVEINEEMKDFLPIRIIFVFLPLILPKECVSHFPIFVPECTPEFVDFRDSVQEGLLLILFHLGITYRSLRGYQGEARQGYLALWIGLWSSRKRLFLGEAHHCLLLWLKKFPGLRRSCLYHIRPQMSISHGGLGLLM